MRHFGQVERVPGDPILGLLDAYRADPNPAKDLDFMLNRSVEDPDGNVWEIVSFEPATPAQALENA